MKNSYLITILSLSVLLACNSDKKESQSKEIKTKEISSAEHQWSDKDKLEFERNCVGVLEKEGVTNAKEYCDCLLETSLLNYPDPSVATELEQNDIVKLFEESKCLDDILLIKLEDPWTEEVELLFLEHCQAAQKEQGVSSEEGSSYCECALEEIKKIVPNPHHVISLTQEELDTVLEKCKTKS